MLAGIDYFGTLRDRWWWRWLFGFAVFKNLLIAFQSAVVVLAIINEFQSIGFWQLFNWWSSILGIVSYGSFTFIAIVIVIDWRAKVSRDKLHWLGVALVFSVSLLPWLLPLIALYFLTPAQLFNL